MGNDFMKSALERAMERADQIELPDTKLKEMKHRSQGEQIAAAFLKNPDHALTDELSKFDAETRVYVAKAIESILLQNITLPRKEGDMTRNREAFRGLALIKQDKDGIQRANDQLANLSNYYMQTMKQNYDQLKSDIEQAMGQIMKQRTGMNSGTQLNVEQSPEFQENWRQLAARLDGEYGKALAQLKEQIVALK